MAKHIKPALLAIGLLSAASVAGIVLGLPHNRVVFAARPRPAKPVVQTTARSESRIRYPAGKYSRLTLPNGHEVVVRSVLNITKPMHFGNFVWDTDQIPAGPVWVRIDLAHQLLSVFRAGHEIGSTVIVYGTDGKPTPTGIFNILEKARVHYSRSYNAPMPYMLRLTDDGVAIHGSKVEEGWATHGCVGVPVGFARLLFAAASKGDLVVIFPVLSRVGRI
jgi:lipoprotein-anchoring transpeptidase ErfK/SrfK